MQFAQRKDKKKNTLRIEPESLLVNKSKEGTDAGIHICTSERAPSCRRYPKMRLIPTELFARVGSIYVYIPPNLKSALLLYSHARM